MTDSGHQNTFGGERRRSFYVLGERLRALRASLGWSQHEAAERAGVSDRSIRKAETGGPIEMKTVILLAEVYSTPEMPLMADDVLAEPTRRPGAAQHEVLVRRWFGEVWNEGRLEAVEGLASRDCQCYVDAMVLRGRTKISQHIQGACAALGDFELRLEQILVQGDWIATRWQAATGAPRRSRRVFNGSTWLRAANGLFVEIWEYWPRFVTTMP